MNKTSIENYDALTLAKYAHDLGLDLEDLEYKINLAKKQTLYIQREDMPVINSDQIKELQQMLLEVGIKFRQIIVPACKLKPVQKNVYIEKAVNPILKHGLYKTKVYLRNHSSITVSKDLYIVDGHHRWLSAMLIKPKLGIKIFQIGLRFTELYRPMIAYSNILQNERKE